MRSRARSGNCLGDRSGVRLPAFRGGIPGHSQHQHQKKRNRDQRQTSWFRHHENLSAMCSHPLAAGHVPLRHLIIGRGRHGRAGIGVAARRRRGILSQADRQRAKRRRCRNSTPDPCQYGKGSETCRVGRGYCGTGRGQFGARGMVAGVQRATMPDPSHHSVGQGRVRSGVCRGAGHLHWSRPDAGTRLPARHACRPLQNPARN